MKNLFPKQISLAMAASLCLFSFGIAQEADTQSQQPDRTARSAALQGEVTGKIMPLKKFLSDGYRVGRTSDQNETADREADSNSESMNEPLVLVVDGMRGVGRTSDADSATETTDEARGDRPRGGRAGAGERAYILVFQNEGVREKAQKICNEQKSDKEGEGEREATDQTATAHADTQKGHVKVSGERSFRGGLMAIMVSDISEEAGQNQTGTSDTREDAAGNTDTDDADTSGDADAEDDN